MSNTPLIEVTNLSLKLNNADILKLNYHSLH